MSVRRLQRSGPASLPMSSRLSRPSFAQAGTGLGVGVGFGRGGVGVGRAAVAGDPGGRSTPLAALEAVATGSASGWGSRRSARARWAPARGSGSGSKLGSGMAHASPPSSPPPGPKMAARSPRPPGPRGSRSCRAAPSWPRRAAPRARAPPAPGAQPRTGRSAAGQPLRIEDGREVPGEEPASRARSTGTTSGPGTRSRAAVGSAATQTARPTTTPAIAIAGRARSTPRRRRPSASLPEAGQEERQRGGERRDAGTGHGGGRLPAPAELRRARSGPAT